MVERTRGADLLVSKYTQELQAVFGGTEGGMVACGPKAGIVIDGDALCLIDKDRFRRAPASAVTKVNIFDMPGAKRTISVIYDMAVVDGYRRSEPGGFSVAFETAEGFQTASQALRVWWGMFQGH
jgi:hypothetical protein